MCNAVTSRVTERVANAARNAAPDPTRPDPTQKTLVVTVSARPPDRNARGQASPWRPSEIPPPWFKPWGPRPSNDVRCARECVPCRTSWFGDPACFACGRPGKLRFPLIASIQPQPWGCGG